MTESSKVDVVGVGLNASDTLIPVAHYPARGSKVEFRSAQVLPGGQVATAMVACQQWGLRTCYVGKIGDDSAAATVAAGWAHAAGVPVIADLDELYPGVETLLKNVDYLITSRDIPGRLMEEHDLKKSLPALKDRFGCRLTAATLGEQGVLAWDGTQFHYAPAFRIEPVDTTGAGDIFHAGFIYGLLQGWPLQRQLEFACAAAALNCTAVGARGGIQSIAAIERLMATGARHSPAYDPSRIT